MFEDGPPELAPHRAPLASARPSRIRSAAACVAFDDDPSFLPGHATLVASLALPLRFLAPTPDDVTAFIAATPPRP